MIDWGNPKMKCPKCKKTVNIEMSFCPHCGFRILNYADKATNLRLSGVFESDDISKSETKSRSYVKYESHSKTDSHSEEITLRQYLRKRKRLLEPEAGYIILKIAKSLTKLKNNQYRNSILLPENILLSGRGIKLLYKTDFVYLGLFRRVKRSIKINFNQSGFSRLPASNDTDAIKLNKLLSEMLTGESPPAIDKNKIPFKYKKLILTMKDPVSNKKLHSISDFIRALERLDFQESVYLYAKYGSFKDCQDFLSILRTSIFVPEIRRLKRKKRILENYTSFTKRFFSALIDIFVIIAVIGFLILFLKNIKIAG